MPDGETFWNPYRLVPIRKEVARATPLTDERFSGRSGILHCQLENLTPLFVGKNRGYPSRFLTRGDQPIIPGSSLKGALRSLAEIVGGGCFSTNTRGRAQRLLDDTYRACNNNRKLCITCRMFGMLGRDRSAGVFKGKVCIGDALMEGEAKGTKQFEIILMNHDIRHSQFYTTPGTGNLDAQCRKMYFHQPQRLDSILSIQDNIRRLMYDKIQRIEALLPGHIFTFQVQFSNLTKDELELLAYVISLEEDVHVTIQWQDGELKLKGPMLHKIGYAKPLGMGSCRISITRIEYLPAPQDNFRSLHRPTGTLLENAILHAEIQRLTAPYTHDKSPTMCQLRKMMVWDTDDSRDFHYPEYDWFTDSKNSATHLKTI